MRSVNETKFFFPFLSTAVDEKLLNRENVLALQNQLFAGRFRLVDRHRTFLTLPELFAEGGFFEETLSKLNLPEDVKLSICCLGIMATCLIDLNWEYLENLLSILPIQEVSILLGKKSNKWLEEWSLYCAIAPISEFSDKVKTDSMFESKNETAALGNLLLGLNPVLFDFYEINKCGLKMAIGRYAEAREKLREIRGRKNELPYFYQLRAYVVEGISAQAQGDFSEVQKALAGQQKILKILGSQSYSLTLKRRQLSFFLESENYQRANALALQAMPSETEVMLTPQMQVMILQQHIRLSVALGRLSEAAVLISKLEQAVARYGPDELVVIPLEEACEKALLVDSDPREALLAIEPIYGKAVVKGYYNGQAVASIYLAHAQLLAGEFEKSATTAQLACLLCEKYGFGRDHVRLLLLMAVSNIALGDRKGAESALGSASFKARRLDLKVSQLISFALGYQFLKAKPSFGLLLGLAFVQREQIVGAVFQLKKCYNFVDSQGEGAFLKNLPERGVAVTPGLLQHQRFVYLARFGKLVTKISFPEMIAELLDFGDVSFFPSDFIVSLPTRGGLLFKKLDFSPVQKRIFIFLLACGTEGVSIEEIHIRLNSKVDFHPLRHGPKIQSALAGLRGCLNSVVGGSVTIAREEDKRGGAYHLQGRFQVVQIWRNELLRLARSVRGEPKPSKAPALMGAERVEGAEVAEGAEGFKEQRLHQILRVLRAEGSFSGAQLSRMFGVTRQALHRDLQKLMKTGHISCNGLGRYAKYAIHK